MSDHTPNKVLRLSDLNKVELTAGDAFLALGMFLSAYYERTSGQGALATVCADVQLEEDDVSVDPAAMSDWIECVSAVLSDKSR